MIWVVLIILALATLLVLAQAFVGPVETQDEEVKTYFDQIDSLEADPDLDGPAKAAARLVLERQILQAKESGTGRGGTLLAGLATIALLGGGAAIYSQIGHPQPLAQSISEQDSLLQQLESRLATDRADDPLGWTLYARALASLGRMEEAVRAYDRALQLNDDPNLRAEAEALLRGPSQAEVQAAMEMSEDDRAAMIRGMVDGLAARLAENPQDAPGWTRLIRARLVLGDPVGADIARMREAYFDRPAVADQILREAGYAPPGGEP